VWTVTRVYSGYNSPRLITARSSLQDVEFEGGIILALGDPDLGTGAVNDVGFDLETGLYLKMGGPSGTFEFLMT